MDSPRVSLISPTLISPTLISPTLISPTIDQFVSFRLLTEVCTIREYEVIQIIFYRFMHNNGLGRRYTIVCADTPDKYPSRVMEFDENLRFSFSILRSLRITFLARWGGAASAASCAMVTSVKACSFLNVPPEYNTWE